MQLLPRLYNNGFNIFKNCSQDPLFYQACNKDITDKITNNELLCGEYLCKSGGSGYIDPTRRLKEGGKICNYENTKLDEVGFDD